MSEATGKITKTVCPYCGVGCGMLLTSVNNRVINVSGDKDHPANFGRLCTKGVTSAEPLRAEGRMTSPLIRNSRDQAPVTVGIKKAIEETASRLNTIVEKYGPDAVAFYVSGQISLEAQYLANKLAKGFIGTNHIDSNSRLCMSSAASGYKLSLGADGPPGSYEDIENCDCFFLIGSNMADCHPILFMRVMDQVKSSGAKLIVVDPRKTSTAEGANLFLQIKPGTDLSLLNGILHLVLKSGNHDLKFIQSHTEGFEELLGLLEAYTPEMVSRVAGIPEKDLRMAAHWIGTSRECTSFWTMGLNQRIHGTWLTNAMCNLHLATGKICRPGSGPFSLTGQPNAMGGREIGYLSHGLPGQRTVANASDRHFVENIWKIPEGKIKPQPGFDAVSLFERLVTGEIKGVWIIGTNPVASMPNRTKVIQGLSNAELVICQDLFFDTETNRYADILLPGAMWAEAEGIMVNSERNLTLMQKAVDPPGAALPDWEILARVATAMGFSEAFSYSGANDVFEEIKNFWNSATGYDLRGVSYERLRVQPVQWPCPHSGSNRNPIRYLNPLNGLIRFPTESGKARLLARPYLPPAELPNDDFPLILNTGRFPHQWHTLTKTGKIPALMRIDSGPFVAVHPDDALRLDLSDGDNVEICSRRGYAIHPARVTDRVLPGNCFSPFHWSDLFGSDLAINSVTNDATDPISHQPELKICAVRLSKVESISNDREILSRQIPLVEVAEGIRKSGIVPEETEDAPLIPLTGLEKKRNVNPINSEKNGKKKLVVVGNGMAGIAAVEQILALKSSLEISVYGAEPFVNYNRILLSDVLSGKMRPEETYLNSREWYQKNGISLNVNQKIMEINPEARTILNDRGERISYDKLLLATGSHPFVPPIIGIEKKGVFTYRNLDDTSKMIDYSKKAHKAAVIGGGLLGLEAGRSLVKRGLHVTVFHLVDRLMELQLDNESGLILKKEVERLGMNVHLNHSICEIIGKDSVEGVSFSNGKAYEADMVVFSTGIRPNIELAKRAGLETRRGIVVNDFMETSQRDIFAVGECAEHRGKTYGIIAPLFEQAKVAARALTGLNDKKYEGTVESATLKVAGIDLVSIGNFLGNSPGCEDLIYSDKGHSLYKKIVLQGNRVVGAILLGNTSDSARILQLVKSQADVTLFRQNLMMGDVSENGRNRTLLEDEDIVCGCMGVNKKSIVNAISEFELTTREGIGEKTKACTSCKSCSPLIDQILQEVLGGEYIPVGEKTKTFCSCFTISRVELVSQIRTLKIKAVSQVLNQLGNGIGCSYCKPGLSYLLSEIWMERHKEERNSRFINDRVHANIQKDGTFSVVPRMYGGVTSPDELRKIAEVAEKFQVPMVKLTGGQRIDLLGVKKEELPLIWAELGMPSGHAYAKAIRTVKTCVGTEFCRFGVQDSTSFGINMEKCFEGLYTPHKVKMAVSGCPRNCAESYVKDIGVVAIQTGWEIYVGGAAGMTVRKGDLLATVNTEDEALRAATLFLQYYREEGNYLERTYDFVVRIGIEKIKKDLFDPDTGRSDELLEHFKMAKEAVVDPWKNERERPVHPYQFKELVSPDG
ncbi:MAG: nitrite reductase large subunit NirB [Nitrospiria bacterium]